jgi:hypothetical protein
MGAADTGKNAIRLSQYCFLALCTTSTLTDTGITYCNFPAHAPRHTGHERVSIAIGLIERPTPWKTRATVTGEGR